MANIDYRARLAGAALLFAPLALAGATGARLAGADVAADIAGWLALAAWIPGVLCLEHFLKKVADRWGALANGLGLVGALFGTNAVAARWAVRLGAEDSELAGWLDLGIAGSSALLALALVLFGAGYARNRIAPPGVGRTLGIGAAGWLVAIAFDSPGLTLTALLALLPACGWIGLRLISEPATWSRPSLR